MSGKQLGLADLEMFLEANTNSAWAPSLHANLAKNYYDVGRITLALEHWQAAWLATRDFVAGDRKMVGDYTLAHWTRLLASLGRYETLEAIFRETQGRELDQGPLSQMWARTREAFDEMAKRPGVSYKCGTYALVRVARELKLNFNVRVLMAVPSPSTGFTMKALVDLSTQLGLGLIPVARLSGNELVVPSVVHWEQDHYGAIVGRRGDITRWLTQRSVMPGS